MNKKVIIGLSIASEVSVLIHGVDSSVAAYVLQQQGYDVEVLYSRVADVARPR